MTTRRRAFTLVEMIASMVILSLVAGTAGAMLWRGAAGLRDAQAGPLEHDRLSAACERLSREFRAIQLRPGVLTAAPDIDEVADQSISWNDGHSLHLDNGSLMLRIDSGTPRVLLEHVSSFSVKALGEDRQELGLPISGSGCDPVRLLLVTLGVTTNGITDTLRVTVFVRSMVTGASP